MSTTPTATETIATSAKPAAGQRATTVKPIPDGLHSITPHLVCAGASAAIAFYEKAFGAEEILRLPSPNGKLVHASVRVGDSVVMLTDEMPEWGSISPKTLKGSPVTIHVYVEHVDAVFARAIAAGATVRMPVADMFWGDRYGIIEDPFGHFWSIATHTRDLSHDEIQKAMPASCGQA